MKSSTKNQARGRSVRRRLAGVVACSALSTACGLAEAPDVDTSSKHVVYGNDDRLDVFAHPDATLRQRAEESTCSMMLNSAIDASNPNNIQFNSQTLGDRLNLCPTERFRDDPTAGFCSATLIDDDLVLTAGHCITAANCSGRSFVFRYYRDAPGSLHQVTSEDVFPCAEVVVRQLGTVGGQNLDYAIVRIDRDATPRFTPAPVRPGNDPLAQGANVAVIGNGSGIPFKIDAGGSVRDNRSGVLDYFEATTDTFGGNSGSGVYETDQYTVAGILVRGETDYVSNGNCTIVNVCSETGCGGEDVTYVAPAISEYCGSFNSNRLCGSPPPPPPPPPPTGNTLPFSASNTNSAQQNTVNRTVTLNAGETITVGTCGLANASFTGDTYLRLFAGGAQVASNDDACGGLGSQLSYTSAGGGAVEIRVGCYASGSCSGTAAWEISGPSANTLPFSASNTNSAQQNTVNQSIAVTAGQTLTIGTCGVPNSSFSGDTYLRLFSGGSQVASNDDACGGLGSQLSYTAPSNGTVEVRVGCYSSGSCSGVVAW